MFSPMSPYGKETPKPSLPQFFDFDTSFVAEETTNYNEVLPPSRVMKDLAFQLGEACLTADLTALIAQKRDSDLEKKAKQTAFPGPYIEKTKKNSKKKPKSKKQNPRSYSLTSLYNPIEQTNAESYINNEDINKKSKVITLQLNILYYSLQIYEPQELQFIRNPCNLLFGHLLSTEFSRSLSVITGKVQEKFECSDDEKDLYEEELCCDGEYKEDSITGELQTLRYIKEEAQVLPSYTVPGGSPRGVKPMNDLLQNAGNYDHDWIFDNEISELGCAFLRVRNKKIEDFLVPQHVSIFAILHLFGQYTEAIHRQAVTPFITPSFPTILLRSYTTCCRLKRQKQGRLTFQLESV